MTYAESVQKIGKVLIHLRAEALKYGSSAFSTKVVYDIEEIKRQLENGDWMLREEMRVALENCEAKLWAKFRKDAEESIRLAKERKLWNRFKRLFKK